MKNIKRLANVYKLTEDKVRMLLSGWRLAIFEFRDYFMTETLTTKLSFSFGGIDSNAPKYVVMIDKTNKNELLTLIEFIGV